MSSSAKSPPHPLHPQTVLKDSDGELRIFYRTRDWRRSSFLLLWLTGWTVICAGIAYGVVTSPKLSLVLIAIPFWSFWIFAVVYVLRLLIQAERLVINRDGLHYSRRIIVPLSSRTIALRELKEFELFSSLGESGIEVQNMGTSLRCLTNLADEELEWLEFQLNRKAKQLRRSLEPGQNSIDTNSQKSQQARHSQGPSSDLPAAPTDCHWSFIEDFEDLRFTRVGRWELSELPGLLFINAFWNGILSVFILVLLGKMPGKAPPMFGGGWWMLFFFLIPFEVLGVMKLVALVKALAEPAHRTSWIVRRHEIELRHSWFGCGRSRRWPIESLSRNNQRRQPDTISALHFDRKYRSDQKLNEIANLFRLRLIDSENREVCSIGGLTEGEARWFRQIIKQKREDWFR